VPPGTVLSGYRSGPGGGTADGGKRHNLDARRHAAGLAERGLHHVDVGTSGGVWGFHRGFCLMIGGEDEVVDRLAPIFASIAPGVDAAPRTPEESPHRGGRSGVSTRSEKTQRPQRRGTSW